MLTFLNIEKLSFILSFKIIHVIYVNRISRCTVCIEDWVYTVEIGYNDIAYNDISAITMEFETPYKTPYTIMLIYTDITISYITIYRL